MRIALVSFEYPPFHGGGIGTYSDIASRWLARLGHDVHVITNGWNGEESIGLQAVGEGALSVHRLHVLDDEYHPHENDALDEGPLVEIARRRDRSLLWSLRVAEAIEALHREHRLDVVECPECFAEGYVTLARRRSGSAGVAVPMCVQLHTPTWKYTELNHGRRCQGWYQVRDAAESYCIRHAEGLSSPSRSLAALVSERLGLDDVARPCEIIPYPLDFDGLPEVQRGSEGDGPPSLLFVGRLEPRKGVTLLVEAAVPVMERIPGLTLHLIGRDCWAGDAPVMMTERLRSLVPRGLRERVVFEGLVRREAVLARYGRATACIFPSPWDNFPYTCWEAMACGGCVIASDQGGTGEVIETGRSGLLFEAGSRSALEGAIWSVLRHPEKAAALRLEAARRIRQVCDPRGTVTARIDHYRRAIERFEGGRRCG